MDGREDEPGADEGGTANGSTPTPEHGGSPDRVTTSGAGAEGSTAPVSGAASGSASEDDLAAETTRQVDTASAARGDVRRPGSPDTRSGPATSGPAASGRPDESWSGESRLR